MSQFSRKLIYGIFPCETWNIERAASYLKPRQHGSDPFRHIAEKQFLLLIIKRTEIKNAPHRTYCHDACQVVSTIIYFKQDQIQYDNTKKQAYSDAQSLQFDGYGKLFSANH
jgi:hypothetical protein